MTRSLITNALVAAVAVATVAAVAFAQNEPEALFSPEGFFATPVAGQGTITTLFFWEEEFSNRFVTRFAAGEILIEESFTFADGTPKQYWRLTHREDGSYGGDVTTEGEDGQKRGPAPVDVSLDADGFRLDYAGYAPGGGDTTFRFRHHLQPRPDGTVVNTVSISWWGIPLAGSTAVFTRQPAP